MPHKNEPYHVSLDLTADEKSEIKALAAKANQNVYDFVTALVRKGLNEAKKK